VDRQHFDTCDSLIGVRGCGGGRLDVPEFGRGLAAHGIPELLEWRLLAVVRARQSRRVLANQAMDTQHQSAGRS